jgi:hypothetical protein
MKLSVLSMFLMIVVVTITTTSAFAPSHIMPSRQNGMVQRQNQPASPLFQSVSPRKSATKLYMGGKMSKFGIFSPAVYVAKFALGTDRLNKIRGKAISLHSQYIGDFCEWVGAYHLRTQLIKKAKTNGDTLGFLV